MNKNFTRREFLRVGSFLGVSGLFGLESCDQLFQPEPTQPQLTFRQLESSCASDEEMVQLQGDFGQIKFVGLMNTPTPCYHLHAELRTMRCGPTSRCPNTYEIAITAIAQDVNCIQCVGAIPYEGEIRGLAPGMYTIVVAHDDRRIASEQVHVGQ